MPDQKLVIDTSKPFDHPEREKLVDLTKTEIKQREKDELADEKRRARRERTPAVVLAERVEAATTLDEVKAAIAAFARGETP